MNKRPRYKIGDVIGKVKLLALDGRLKCGVKRWLCLCQVCGNIEVRNTCGISRAKSENIGCARCGADERNRKNTEHGGSKSLLYGIWRGMKDRCDKPTHPSFAYYGGKGVRVCDEWRAFSGFRVWAIGSGYKPGLSIDRVDSNLNYDPSNCEWVTKAENSTRATVLGHYWRSMTCNA